MTSIDPAPAEDEAKIEKILQKKRFNLVPSNGAGHGIPRRSRFKVLPCNTELHEMWPRRSKKDCRILLLINATVMLASAWCLLHPLLPVSDPELKEPIQICKDTNHPKEYEILSCWLEGSEPNVNNCANHDVLPPNTDGQHPLRESKHQGQFCKNIGLFGQTKMFKGHQMSGGCRDGGPLLYESTSVYDSRFDGSIFPVGDSGLLLAAFVSNLFKFQGQSTVNNNCIRNTLLIVMLADHVLCEKSCRVTYYTEGALIKYKQFKFFESHNRNVGEEELSRLGCHVDNDIMKYNKRDCRCFNGSRYQTYKGFGPVWNDGPMSAKQMENYHDHCPCGHVSDKKIQKFAKYVRELEKRNRTRSRNLKLKEENKRLLDTLSLNNTRKTSTEGKSPVGSGYPSIQNISFFSPKILETHSVKTSSKTTPRSLPSASLTSVESRQGKAEVLKRTDTRQNGSEDLVTELYYHNFSRKLKNVETTESNETGAKLEAVKAIVSTETSANFTDDNEPIAYPALPMHKIGLQSIANSKSTRNVRNRPSQDLMMKSKIDLDQFYKDPHMQWEEVSGNNSMICTFYSGTADQTLSKLHKLGKFKKYKKVVELMKRNLSVEFSETFGSSVVTHTSQISEDALYELFFNNNDNPKSIYIMYLISKVQGLDPKHYNEMLQYLIKDQVLYPGYSVKTNGLATSSGLVFREGSVSCYENSNAKCNSIITPMGMLDCVPKVTNNFMWDASFDKVEMADNTVKVKGKFYSVHKHHIKSSCFGNQVCSFNAPKIEQIRLHPGFSETREDEDDVQLFNFYCDHPPPGVPKKIGTVRFMGPVTKCGNECFFGSICYKEGKFTSVLDSYQRLSHWRYLTHETIDILNMPGIYSGSGLKGMWTTRGFLSVSGTAPYSGQIQLAKFTVEGKLTIWADKAIITDSNVASIRRGIDSKNMIFSSGNPVKATPTGQKIIADNTKFSTNNCWNVNHDQSPICHFEKTHPEKYHRIISLVLLCSLIALEMSSCAYCIFVRCINVRLTIVRTALDSIRQKNNDKLATTLCCIPYLWVPATVIGLLFSTMKLTTSLILSILTLFTYKNFLLSVRRNIVKIFKVSPNIVIIIVILGSSTLYVRSDSVGQSISTVKKCDLGVCKSVIEIKTDLQFTNSGSVKFPLLSESNYIGEVTITPQKLRITNKGIYSFSAPTLSPKTVRTVCKSLDSEDMFGAYKVEKLGPLAVNELCSGSCETGNFRLCDDDHNDEELKAGLTYGRIYGNKGFWFGEFSCPTDGLELIKVNGRPQTDRPIFRCYELSEDDVQGQVNLAVTINGEEKLTSSNDVRDLQNTVKLQEIPGSFRVSKKRVSHSSLSGERMTCKFPGTNSNSTLDCWKGCNPFNSVFVHTEGEAALGNRAFKSVTGMVVERGPIGAGACGSDPTMINNNIFDGSHAENYVSSLSKVEGVTGCTVKANLLNDWKVEDVALCSLRKYTTMDQCEENGQVWSNVKVTSAPSIELTSTDCINSLVLSVDLVMEMDYVSDGGQLSKIAISKCEIKVEGCFGKAFESTLYIMCDSADSGIIQADSMSESVFLSEYVPISQGKGSKTITVTSKDTFSVKLSNSGFVDGGVVRTAKVGSICESFSSDDSCIDCPVEKGKEIIGLKSKEVMTLVGTVSLIIALIIISICIIRMLPQSNKKSPLPLIVGEPNYRIIEVPHHLKYN